MSLELGIEKFQRARRDYAMALEANPLDKVPQRRTGDVFDHEARLIGAVRAKG
jgi:hypothetical protein